MPRPGFRYIKVDEHLTRSRRFAGLPQKSRTVLAGTLVESWGRTREALSDGWLEVREWNRCGTAEGRRLAIERGYVEVEDGRVYMVGWQELYPSRADIEKLSAVRREAGRLGGRPKQSGSNLVPGEGSKLLDRSKPRYRDRDRTPLPPATEDDDRDPPGGYDWRRGPGPRTGRQGRADDRPTRQPPPYAAPGGRPDDQVAVDGAARARALLAEREAPELPPREAVNRPGVYPGESPEEAALRQVEESRAGRALPQPTADQADAPEPAEDEQPPF